jgi:CHASE2 domain-containing sensor protein/signal transduction histidine kinase
VRLRPALRRRRDDALIAAVLAAAALWLALGGFAWRGDRLLQDAALSWWARPAPPDIVIVAIDDASIEAIGRWPWPRTVHATLLQRLAEARPRAIALDLLLSEPEPAADPWLAEALARAAPVVMPVAWTAAGAGLSVLEPTPLLRAPLAALGSAEPAVDADGVLRHLFLSSGPAGAPYPHLALALLQAGGEALHPSLQPVYQPVDAGAAGTAGPAGPAAWRRDGRLRMRFAGPPGSVPRVSYVDVLQGRVPTEALAGRYLLVGMTAQGLGDTLATPVNAHHRAMPGIEVLANAIALLRDGRGLRSLPPWAEAAASAIALALLVAGFRRLGARRALPLALASVPVVVLASGLSVGAGWVWSPLPYALPALLAYPLWSWRRLEHAVQVLDREIRALAVERVAAPPVPPAAPGAGVGDPLALRLAELAQAGRLLREARSFLAGTLERLPTAMLLGDEQGRVALANAQAAALFEVGQTDELLGLDLPRLLAEFSPVQALDWGAALAALRPDGPALTVEARLGAGEWLLQVAAVEMLGQPRLIVSIADLSPVRAAERQREETLAFVSHDLRSPAHGLLMLTGLAREGRSPLPPDRLLEELQRLAARLLALADDFVHASRAQTRPLTPVAVSPEALLDDGMAAARAAAAAAGVTLALQVEPGPPVRLDRDLVLRALANLASNAVRHTPAGGTVRVHAWRDPAGLCVEVTDAGPGLAPDQRQALLRGEDALRVAGPGGVGLGLLFVRRVARRHGGTLSAQPGPGGCGECMTLRLPDQAGARGSGHP